MGLVRHAIQITIPSDDVSDSDTEEEQRKDVSDSDTERG